MPSRPLHGAMMVLSAMIDLDPVDLRDEFVAPRLGALQVALAAIALVGELLSPFQLQFGALERGLQIAQVRLLGVIVEFHQFRAGRDFAARFEVKLAHDAGHLGRDVDAVHGGDRSDRLHVGAIGRSSTGSAEMVSGGCGEPENRLLDHVGQKDEVKKGQPADQQPEYQADDDESAFS